MLILGIETSCDETSVAVLREDGTVLANLISSQIDRHQPYGGVVPEIASREHLAMLMPLVEQALRAAGVTLREIGGVAATSAPGLIGALLVGVAGAQGISYGMGIPLAAVNHLEGHIFSPYLRREGPAVPVPDRFFAMVVSGGHSSIYDVRRDRIVMLNRTRDDAAGEVFDKVAKFIGLPYPGGPHVERLSAGGDSTRFRFPPPQFKEDTADFSFSGLKSAAIRVAREHGLRADGAQSEPLLPDFCASFQQAIVDQLISRLDQLWKREAGGADGPSEVVIAGGVAANGALRRAVAAWCESQGVVARIPEKIFCTDNGAMIAFAAAQNFAARSGDPRRVVARSRAQVGLEAKPSV